MTRTLGLVLLFFVAVAVWLGYGVSTMLDHCEARVREIIATADPLDRAPPPNVATVIKQTLGLNELADYLATALLSRYACRNGSTTNTDWLFDQPALTWRLREKLREGELLALFAATADFGKDQPGLNRRARRIFGTEISQLSADKIRCLTNKAVGRISNDGIHPQSYITCEESIPPPETIVDWVPVPQR